MQNFIKKNLLVILLSPLVINFFLNLNTKNNDYLNYLFENKIVIFAILINSLFYFQIAKLINIVLKLNSSALSLVYFLTSFYIFNLLLLPFFKDISFKVTLIVVSLLWFCFLTYKVDKKIEILNATCFYIICSIFNNRFYIELSSLSGFKELNTDVPLQWFKLANLISSENFYFAFSNNVIEGQTLAISYIQSLLFNLNFYSFDFSFIRLNSNLIIIFSLFLIYDLKLSRKDKIISSISLILFLLNSDWLTYLFIDSLMLEGLVGLIFAVFLINIKDHVNNRSSSNSYLYFFFFSFLLFTKQFVSTIALIILFYLLVKYKNRHVIAGFIPYFIHRVYIYFYTPDTGGFELLRGTSIKELFFDILTLDNLAFENINKIFNQLYLDKPFIYVLLIFFSISFLRIFFKANNSEGLTLNISFFAIILNFLLVFLLYIVWWKDFGIQSSYRYVLNLFLLLFYSLLVNINLFQKDI